MKLVKPENVEYEQLRGFEKSAILVNYLGKDALRVLFKSLEDGDVRKLLNVMQKYRVVPVHVTKKVLEEFYEWIYGLVQELFPVIIIHEKAENVDEGWIWNTLRHGIKVISDVVWRCVSPGTVAASQCFENREAGFFS